MNDVGVSDKTVRNIVLIAVSGFILYQISEYLPILFMNSSKGDEFLQIVMWAKTGCFILWGIIAFWLFFFSKNKTH
jgi:hypothetical protein